LAETLRVNQKLRFDQIVLQLQQQGRYGFSDPKIVEALHLTSAQRQRIRGIQNDAHKTWSDHLFTGRKIVNPDQFWKDVQERVVAVLEPSQRESWRQMSGTPVEIELREGYPFDGKNVALKLAGSPALASVSVMHGPGDHGGSGFGHKIFFHG